MAPGLFVQPENTGLAFFRTSITSLTRTTWRTCDHTLPVFVSIASAAVLFIHVLVSSKITKPQLGLTVKSEDANRESTEGGHIQRHGGRAIFATEVLNLIGSLELLRVALLRVLAIQGPQSEKLELIIASIPFVSLVLRVASCHFQDVFSRHIHPFLHCLQSSTRVQPSSQVIFHWFW